MLQGKVLICDPMEENGIQILRESGLSVDYRPNINHEELTRIAKNYDVLVVRSRTRVTREIIEHADSLKIIGRAGAGLDNIDQEAARNRGVKIINVEEAVTTAVAELTFGLMISLLRHVERGLSGLRRGEWLKNQLVGSELRGKTLGVVGLGRIGSRVAQLATSFGMQILANDIVEIDQGVLNETGARMVPLETLLRNADIVTIHVNLTDRSHRMINEDTLRMMKPSAYLINTARGAVIDEESLFRALSQGRIKGAALDVFQVEPPSDSRLVSMPNVLCTPHIGAQTAEAQSAASKMLAVKILNELHEVLPSSKTS